MPPLEPHKGYVHHGLGNGTPVKQHYTFPPSQETNQKEFVARESRAEPLAVSVASIDTWVRVICNPACFCPTRNNLLVLFLEIVDTLFLICNGFFSFPDLLFVPLSSQGGVLIHVGAGRAINR